MQSQSENEPVQIFNEIFLNDYNKNLIALSLIFMFSIVFNLIYFLIDSLIDKDKHYRLSAKSAGIYQASKQHSKPKSKLKGSDEDKESFEIDQEKVNIQAENKKIDYSVWSYRNLQISFVHSSLCSLWLIRIIFLRHEELFDDLLYHVSWDTYLMVAFSCGYFLYDFYDIYANGYLKSEIVVCAHHVIVLISFTYHISHLISVGYTVVALTMEINSVFLHGRKLLKFYGYKKTDQIVRINKVVNILTFVVCRFGVLIQIYYSLYFDGYKVPSGYVSFLLICVMLMTMINVILFKRLLVKDFLSSSSKKTKNTITTNNDNDIKNTDNKYEYIKKSLFGKEYDEDIKNNNGFNNQDLIYRNSFNTL